MESLTTLGMAYKQSAYTIVIAIMQWPKHAVAQAYNFCAETQIGDGDTSVFVVPSAAFAQVLTSTFVASTALTKDPQRF